MSKKDKLSSIDLDDLDQVTGGVVRSPSVSSTGGDDQVTTLLQGIADSLKQMSAGETNDKGNSFRQLMPFLLLLSSGRRGGGPPWGGGGPFGGPCGCG